MNNQFFEDLNEYLINIGQNLKTSQKDLIAKYLNSNQLITQSNENFIGYNYQDLSVDWVNIHNILGIIKLDNDSSDNDNDVNFIISVVFRFILFWINKQILNYNSKIFDDFFNKLEVGKLDDHHISTKTFENLELEIALFKNSLISLEQEISVILDKFDNFYNYEILKSDYNYLQEKNDDLTKEIDRLKNENNIKPKFTKAKSESTLLTISVICNNPICEGLGNENIDLERKNRLLKDELKFLRDEIERLSSSLSFDDNLSEEVLPQAISKFSENRIIALEEELETNKHNFISISNEFSLNNQELFKENELLKKLKHKSSSCIDQLLIFIETLVEKTILDSNLKKEEEIKLRWNDQDSLFIINRLAKLISLPREKVFEDEEIDEILNIVGDNFFVQSIHRYLQSFEYNMNINSSTSKSLLEEIEDVEPINKTEKSNIDLNIIYSNRTFFLLFYIIIFLLGVLIIINFLTLIKDNLFKDYNNRKKR